MGGYICRIQQYSEGGLWELCGVGGGILWDIDVCIAWQDMIHVTMYNCVDCLDLDLAYLNPGDPLHSSTNAIFFRR